MDNFNYFVITYLNDWYQWDERFMREMVSTVEEDRLTAVQDAAKWYRVMRNFRVIEEENRLEYALKILRRIRDPVTKNNVVKKVNDTSDRFGKKYGVQNYISASSKLLWLRFKSPVIMYDSRAVRCLRNNFGLARNANYKEYRKSWMDAYHLHRDEISAACKKQRIKSLKGYTFAYDKDDEEIADVISSDWFQERVFDKYLWFNGGS